MGFDAAHTISSLSKLLIDAGADINQSDAKGRVALQYLISHPKLTDRDMAPLYDLLFTRCRLDLSIKNAWGYTPHRPGPKAPLPGGPAAENGGVSWYLIPTAPPTAGHTGPALQKYCAPTSGGQGRPPLQSLP